MTMDNLEKIQWTNNLSINNIGIDSDHKKLLEIYNNLIELVEFDKDREEFAKILSEMTDYSLLHFTKEEKYMQEISYPKLAEHKQFHRDFSYKIAMYNANLIGQNPPEPTEIISFLKKWWLNHILRNDSDFEKYKVKIKSDVIYSKY